MNNNLYYFNAGNFPQRIEIELTNECNSRCVYCPRRFMKCKTGFMKMLLFKEFVDEASVFPDRALVLFRRGESLLHPEFIRILNYCKGKFKDIQLATNASLMNKNVAQAIKNCVTFLSFSIELPRRYKNTGCLIIKRP